jgi:hypothetical protein
LIARRPQPSIWWKTGLMRRADTSIGWPSNAVLADLRGTPSQPRDYFIAAALAAQIEIDTISQSS